ncbi:hypothetical protein HHK36_015422 [Tetracentron sinense]|uniref:Remorin C-terminal domain-containing protein n=1 Tax=Tetracentron sinense TaxID=13715 RepID=A0A834Z549_TETSI|nr:hypothetical protein HHK36_015422 [Tetracentron sinense]
MSRGYESSDGSEYASTIAAAAFAINSLEEASSQNQKKMREGPETFLTKSKSKSQKKDATVELSDPGRVSRRFSGKDAREEKQYPGSVVDRRTLPNPSLTLKPTLFPSGDAKQTRNSTRPKSAETKADSWEKDEMDKLRKWCDKMNYTILSWENEKRTKAKRRIDRTESKLARRRARALQHYRSEMARIDQIAGGARAQVEERRRNDESKAKEKVKKIRSTGKVPVMCFCF